MTQTSSTSNGRKSAKLATRTVKIGDEDLMGITEVVVKGNCYKCGKPAEEKLRDLYCHFPVRRSLDNPTATFAIRKPICEDCLSGVGV